MENRSLFFYSYINNMFIVNGATDREEYCEGKLKILSLKQILLSYLLYKGFVRSF